MTRNARSSVCGLALVLVLSAAPAAAAWEIHADVAESCNCNAACPCIFGSPATNDHCEGSRLVEIRGGHFEDVDLEGVRVMITFRMGAWTRYYVDGTTEDRQVDAARELVRAAWPGFAATETISTERRAIAVVRSPDRLEFSVPDSTVEIEVMEGSGGNPVTVHHLPSADNYTQYKSIRNEHRGGDRSFSYSGTNGFTATIDAKG